MRTTFFAVALCAATAIAAPHGRHLSKVVDKAESEVTDLEGSLKTRHAPRPGKKLVNEIDNLTGSVRARAPLDTISEVEDQVDDLTGSLGVRTLLGTSTVSEVQDEVDSLTGSLGARTPLDSGIVSEVEDDVDSLTGTVGARTVLDTSTVSEVENEVNSLTGSLGVRAPLDTDIMSEVESEVNSLTGSLGVRAPVDTGVVSEVESEVNDVTNLDTSNLGVRDDTALLDKVVKHVENIMALNIPSADKLQQILNTIVTEIEARDAAEKRSLSLSHLALPGLDLAALDSASIDELLSDLSVLLQSLVKVVDPSEVSTVKQAISNLKDTMSEVENDLGLSKRGLAGLNLPVIDSLGLASLVDDIDAIVAYIQKAVIKEVKSVSPSLAKEIKSLLSDVTGLLPSL